MDAASFINVDAEVPAVQPPTSGAEIVAELLETEDVSNDNNDAIKTENEPLYCTDRNKLLPFIRTTQKFSLFSRHRAIVQSYLNHAACIIDQHFADKSRQTTIRGYFQSL